MIYLKLPDDVEIKADHFTLKGDYYLSITPFNFMYFYSTYTESLVCFADKRKEINIQP